MKVLIQPSVDSAGFRPLTEESSTLLRTTITGSLSSGVSAKWEALQDAYAKTWLLLEITDEKTQTTERDVYDPESLHDDDLMAERYRGVMNRLIRQSLRRQVDQLSRTPMAVAE